MTTTPPRAEPEPIEAEFEPAGRGAPQAEARSALKSRVTRLEAMLWAAGAAILGAVVALVLLNTRLGGDAGSLEARIGALETERTTLSGEISASAQALKVLEGRVAEGASKAEAAEAATQSTEQQIAAINRQLAALAGAAPDAASGGNPFGRLLDRVEALETTLQEDATAPRTTRQMQRALSELSDQVAALDEASAGFTTALNRRQAALTAVESTVEELEADLRTLEARLASTEKLGAELGDVRRSVSDLGAASESARAPVLAAAAQTRLVKALGDLTGAAEKGRPFVAQQQTLARLLPNDAEVAELREIARRGAPSLVELRRDFQPALRAAERASAAESDDGWNWLRGAVSGVVTVRRTDADDRTSVRLREAEAAMDAGDVAAAIAAIEELDGPAGIAMADWAEKAARRAELDARIEALNARLLAPPATNPSERG